MKTIIFITAFLFLAFGGDAQNLTSPAGIEGANASYSFSWSIGELVVTTGTGGALVATQGYQQPTETENLPPIANAGEDQSVDEGDLVTLNGSLSYDPESMPIVYSWSSVEGITLIDPSSANPTFTAPEVESDAYFTFVLVVNDGNSSSKPDSVSILINNLNTTPINLVISNIRIESEIDTCFGATQNIIVAGDGFHVDFEDGSIVNLIAGHSIRILPGTHFYEGCFAHAYITTTNSFCSQSSDNMIASDLLPEKSMLEHPTFVEDVKIEQFVKVYPNPNNGQFIVEFNGVEPPIKICIYNSIGSIIHESKMDEEKSEIELVNVERGIYFINACNRNQNFSQKMIIQ